MKWVGVEFEMGRELGVKNEGSRRREKEVRKCFYFFGVWKNGEGAGREVGSVR